MIRFRVAEQMARASSRTLTVIRGNRLLSSQILLHNQHEKKLNKGGNDPDILQLESLIPNLEAERVYKNEIKKKSVEYPARNVESDEDDFKAPNKEISTQAGESFDLLNRFLEENFDEDFEKNHSEHSSSNAYWSSDAPSTDKSLEKLSENSQDDFKTVDIDKTDETVFNMDFLKAKSYEDVHDINNPENSLFNDIFNKYLQPTKENNTGHFDISHIRESLDIEPRKDTEPPKRFFGNTQLKNISDTLKDELFVKASKALHPTISIIEGTESIGSLIEFHNRIIDKWREQIYNSKADQAVFENTYFRELLKDSVKFSNSHQSIIDMISESAKTSPDSPLLNVFTVPIIFNSVLHRLCFDFHDGQLAISLFNNLKTDINLYTVICNQQTYNEILRTIWLYFGKSNLYGIEMIYIEMLNNGFTGDVITFNILKNIIMDYHSLKMGKHHLNMSSRLPIWSKEDDKRVESLERHLKTLARNLRI